jgi:CRISPR-associated endoribonuclease Cas6
MQSPLQLAHPSRQLRQGELYALQLRLHPQEAGQVAANAGPHIQAAFLDLVRQLDPALAKDLHTPNQRRPYTLGMLQGFNTLTVEQQIAALNHGETLTVSPGQVYWLRMTMLDDTVLDTFMRALLWKAQGLIFCIGETPFAVSRIVTRPETPGQGSAWVASSSFTALHHLAEARASYHFEFHSPTVFSLGNRTWGKYLHLFPEPANVFESLAMQWEQFAPQSLRLAADQLTPRTIGQWCAENVVASRYTLTTCHLSARRFGQVGFQGTILYDVKGKRHAPEARWLSTLARFAFFSGVGYKTAMGMGQSRCLSLPQACTLEGDRQEGSEP